MTARRAIRLLSLVSTPFIPSTAFADDVSLFDFNGRACAYIADYDDLTVNENERGLAVATATCRQDDPAGNRAHRYAGRAGIDTILARGAKVFGAARPHHAYLFANRHSTRMKVLVYDGFGIRLAARRLNMGQFVWTSEDRQPRIDQLTREIAVLRRLQFGSSCSRMHHRISNVRSPGAHRCLRICGAPTSTTNPTTRPAPAVASECVSARTSARSWTMRRACSRSSDTCAANGPAMRANPSRPVEALDGGRADAKWRRSSSRSALYRR